MLKNLTKREKKLLKILFTLIIVFIIFKTVTEPRIVEIKKLKLEEESYTRKVEIKKHENTLKEKYKRDFELLSEKSKKLSDKFYKDITQENIVYILNSIIKELDFNVTSISFEENKYEGELQEKSENFEVGKNINFLDVLISYESDYYQIMEFIKKVEKIDKKILISSVEMIIDNLGIKGNINLRFYESRYVQKQLKRENYES
ncbi:hypothetical protein CLPU_17c00090 [Gottschalkia purinilytica]|uniref:Tfp pilus assembly protein PilO n=1 Tax=Gottschalkia purinilytica TaxID=1503 RepID=A0A0L0W794_GOTPU|nr:hypothetical protein [Gottschalkia purinilytica]KNF07384.1 hypothetical protein CLPU_17c00090 [Gottschalkia purinilytica]